MAYYCIRSCTNYYEHEPITINMHVYVILQILGKTKKKGRDNVTYWLLTCICAKGT